MQGKKAAEGLHNASHQRSALEQSPQATRAVTQAGDKALPDNASYSPRPEAGCTAEPQPFDHSAPFGCVSSQVTPVGRGKVGFNGRGA